MAYGMNRNPGARNGANMWAPAVASLGSESERMCNIHPTGGIRAASADTARNAREKVVPTNACIACGHWAARLEAVRLAARLYRRRLACFNGYKIL